MVHFVVVEGWQDGSLPSVIDAVHRDVTAKTKKLRASSPEAGAYFNETDSKEPEWQKSFFADKYGRLKEIKRAVDPHDVLWCRNCLSSEAYVEQDGRLCRAPNETREGSEEYAKKVVRERCELRP